MVGTVYIYVFFASTSIASRAAHIQPIKGEHKTASWKQFHCRVGPVAAQREDQHQLPLHPFQGQKLGKLENGQWQGENQHYSPLACSCGCSRRRKHGTELEKYQRSVHQS